MELKVNTTVKENIVDIDYEDEMRKSYIDYAMSVIVSRALPDIRDGLKPVHRRILYTMFEDGLYPDKKYRKSATTVGDVLGRYHPHGDASIYNAMVRLTQNFILNVPLIDGHGNFGSMDGDSAAAYRYTEAKLLPASLWMLNDIDKNVVDFQDNFEGVRKEPVVLPSRFPQLLINGVSGIAVGMMTNIPPHNPVEVIKAISEYIDHPDMDTQGLLKIIKGPDFPTGGTITNKDELAEIYEHGVGRLHIRAKLQCETVGNSKTNLIITEIPYTWSGCKENHIEKLLKLLREGNLNELSDIRDESSKEGVRLVLEVKKGINIEKLINKLYKKTTLEDTMTVSFLVIVNQRPKTLSLKQLIQYYIEFQKEITLNKYKYLYEKEKNRVEVLEGFVKAYDVLDLIIEVLRGSEDDRMAKNCLIEGIIDGIILKTKKSKKEAAKFNFTEMQADAILAMPLRKIIRLEINRINEDYNKATANLNNYHDIITHENRIIDIIKVYLGEMKKQFGMKRKTQIDTLITEDVVEELIEEDLVLLIDRFGYIKAVDTATINRANNEEAINEFKHVIPIKNTDKLCAFTNMGNLYQVKVVDIPKTKIKEKGIIFDNLSKMVKEEVVLFSALSDIVNKKVCITTRLGIVKMVEGVELESVRTATSIIKFEDGDTLMDLKVIDPSNLPSHQIIISKEGYVLKYEVASIPILKKNSRGVNAINLSEKDEVINVCFIENQEPKKISIGDKEIDVSKMRKKKIGSIGIKFK